jgi:two-component system NtrC family sensor kinase
MSDTSKPPDLSTHQLRSADRVGTLRFGLGRLAHELGTPLNVIVGRATMLLNDATASEKAQHNARVILENAQSITRRIRAALDLAEQRPLSVNACKLREVLDHVVPFTQPYGTFAVSGDVDLHAALDLERTTQVLTHLVIEALVAGGKVTIDVKAVDVPEPADPHCSPGRYARIEIAGTEAFAISDDFARDLGRRMSGYVMREQAGFLEGKDPKAIALHLPLR